VAAFVSLAVPRELTRGRRSWVEHFYDGLLALAACWDVPLAGGDLAQSPVGVAADIVVIGAVERGHALLRSGASAADALYVTGTLGGAAAELRALMRSRKRNPAQPPAGYRGLTKATAEHPHFLPEPRINVGRALLQRKIATAAIDMSDGLSVDLQHICDESDLRAEVDAALLPLGHSAAFEDALHGGDDYELLFTADAETRVPRKIAGVPLRRIGRMLRRKSGAPQMMLVEDGRRRELKPEGWQHF
jgi:thiamine-monophosphate kinase